MFALLMTTPCHDASFLETESDLRYLVSIVICHHKYIHKSFDRVYTSHNYGFTKYSLSTKFVNILYYRLGSNLDISRAIVYIVAQYYLLLSQNKNKTLITYLITYLIT